MLAWDSGIDFIRNQLHARVRHNYFLLFLLALHQRLATIHLAGLIGQTSYARLSRRPIRRSVAREIQHLRTRIFEFMIRCSFAEVSNMKTYTEVYRAWQRIFRVEALLEEVKTEMGELDDYLQRLQMERETRFINRLTWVFLPVTLVFGFWGMNLWANEAFMSPKFSLFTVGCVVLYTVLMLLSRPRKY